MSESNPHVEELLPWYVAGTLEAEERETVRRHLADCERCRAQVPLLDDAATLIEREGPAVLDDHPSSEQLVDAVLGELDEATTARVLRHVELCSTCRSEARLVREGAEDEVGTRRRTAGPVRAGIHPGVWFASGAVAASVAMALGLWFFRAADELRIVQPNFVVPAQLSGEPDNVFRTPADGAPLLLSFEADFSAAQFPIRLEIVDSTGDVTAELKNVGRDLLVQDVYVFVACPAERCRPGAYVARLVASDARTVLAYPFTIE